MTAFVRTTDLRRPAIAFVLVVGLLGWGAATAADWGSGSSYYYPGPSGQSGDPYGRQTGTGGGSYRPPEGASAPWQAPAAPGSAPTWGQGGGSFGGSQPQVYRGQPATGQSDRPATDYRFRLRPEDKGKKTDEGLRYRPDPELARRSQQFWGVPGQDPSNYGGGPGVVFRPLYTEKEQPGRSATGQKPSEAAQPPWGGHPGAPAYGGYPY